MSIKIDLKIFLFFFLFLLTSQFEIYIILFCFAILHEIGHLMAGVLLNFKPEEIRLTPMGLQISFKTQPNDINSKVKKAIIAIAGPITNFFIVVFVMIIMNFSSSLQNLYIYQIIVYSNLLIGLFNLIPIYQMDGGRVLKEILSIIYGRKKAYKITYITSKTVLIIITAIASIAILYIQNIAILLIIVYLWYLEINEIRLYNRRKNIEKIVENIT